ncbi:MAG: hypothetical protein HOP27_16490 [Anaerolineales bacterium]|nr:hypothetical protein [Anaerolineales bacterium]
MTEHWLHTDEKADLVASLAMLEVAINQTAKDIAAWKWVVIAMHSALQSAIACHLGAIGNSFLVAKQEDAEAWLKAHEDGTPYPEMMMDSFPNLYEKLKRQEIYGYKFVPRGTQGRSIKKINEYRNEFIHFMPKGWSLEVSGLPSMCQDCLDVINELDEHTLDIRWHDDVQRSSFRILLNSCLEKIKSLKTEYGT